MDNEKTAICLSNKITQNQYNQIIKILHNLISKIKDQKKIDETLLNINTEKLQTIFMYPSICMLLGESKKLLDNNIDWDKVGHQYMIAIKEYIEKYSFIIPYGLFGGYADIGFGAHSLYISSNYYKKFIDSLNKIITTHINNNINNYIENIENLNMIDYDIINGLSGVLAYLLLFREEPEIKKHIEKILKYLILITKDRLVFNKKVPGWHISSENQFLDHEKQLYKKGNFNLGLSHGISGVLAVLSIAARDGIEVVGQKEAIQIILNHLKRFNYTNNKDNIYWPGVIKFEDYIKGNCKIFERRAGWCYGTPGIARAMYLGGKITNDTESILLSIKALEGVCKMDDSELLLDSPTICHGYAGLISVIQAMYFDTQNPIFDIGRYSLLSKLLRFYDNNSKFGFYNIEHYDNKQHKLSKEDDISFLQGTIGIILTLLSFIKPIETNWMRHLLIN